MLFSQYSNSQILIPVPQYGLSINGQVKFSPGNGFVFGRGGGSFDNTFKLNNISNQPGHIPQALNYGWEQRLSNDSHVLNANVTLTNNRGSIVYNETFTYRGEYGVNKKEYTYSLANISANDLEGLKITFTTNSSNTLQNWMGPEIKNLYANVILEQDRCSIDPSSSPSCSGYNKAQINKLCEVNQQLSPMCAGYRFNIPSASSPINDTLQVDMFNNINSPSSMLMPYTKPNVVVTPVQKTENKTTPGNKSTNALQRKTQEKDAQGEKLSDMQSTGPDISLYTKTGLIDAPFYRTREIYKNVIVQDNARAQRQLTQRSNISHGRMVDEQYRR